MKGYTNAGSYPKEDENMGEGYGVLVYALNTTSNTLSAGDKVILAPVGAGEWEIVSTYQENCFIGFITGNIDENQKYEVRTYLGEVINFILSVSKLPDEEEFRGGADAYSN